DTAPFRIHPESSISVPLRGDLLELPEQGPLQLRIGQAMDPPHDHRRHAHDAVRHPTVPVLEVPVRQSIRRAEPAALIPRRPPARSAGVSAIRTRSRLPPPNTTSPCRIDAGCTDPGDEHATSPVSSERSRIRRTTGTIMLEACASTVASAPVRVATGSLERYR